MAKMQSLTVLIPAYNEEKLIKKTILSMIQYLNSLRIKFEIIVCINDSTDETEEIVMQLSKKYKKLKYFSINDKGFGIALRKGIERSTKNLITYMPADDEADKDFIRNALKHIKNYDVICGSRYIKGAHQSTTKTFRKFLSISYAKIIQLFLSKEFTEFGTIKMFRTDWAKKVVKECKSVHWEFQVEMLYFALRDKKRIKEIPINVIYQTERESKVNVIADVFSLFKSALKYGIKLRIHQLLH